MNIIDNQLSLCAGTSLYMPDNLKFWYDGILNTKNGHDPSSAVWDNLKGGISADAPAAWGDDHAVGDGASQIRTNAPIIPSLGDFSIETVVEISSFANQTFLAQRNGWLGNYICQELYLNKIGFRIPQRIDTGYTPELNKKFSFSSQRHGKYIELFINGIQLISTELDPEYAFQQTTTYLMSVWNSAYMVGKLYCARVYYKALSAEEILHNFETDKKRFNFT